uniref:Ig-like domain-containing protein n=1 Tax=Anguilla anguilla TaxID=7936 RepID=A0A0E9WI29_ANGAN
MCLGRPSAYYGFLWFRNESNRVNHKSNKNIYTIARVTEAHSGVYKCSGKVESDPVILNVSGE